MRNGGSGEIRNGNGPFVKQRTFGGCQNKGTDGGGLGLRTSVAVELFTDDVIGMGGGENTRN
jgi:hypothetical protein